MGVLACCAHAGGRPLESEAIPYETYLQAGGLLPVRPVAGNPGSLGRIRPKPGGNPGPRRWRRRRHPRPPLLSARLKPGPLPRGKCYRNKTLAAAREKGDAPVGRTHRKCVAQPGLFAGRAGPVFLRGKAAGRRRGVPTAGAGLFPAVRFPAPDAREACCTTAVTRAETEPFCAGVRPTSGGRDARRKKGEVCGFHNG